MVHFTLYWESVYKDCYIRSCLPVPLPSTRLPVYLLPMCAHNSHCHLYQLFPFVVHVNSVFKFATASQTITFIKRKITFIKVFFWKKRYFGIITTHDTYCYCVFKFTFPPKTVFLWCWNPLTLVNIHTVERVIIVPVLALMKRRIISFSNKTLFQNRQSTLTWFNLYLLHHKQ